MNIRAALVVGILALGVPAVFAQPDPIIARKALMKGNLDNAIILSKMMREQSPFDAAKIETAFAQFAETAQKLPSLFPDNAKPQPPLGTYSASLKIWQSKSDFDAKAAAFAKVVSENRAQARTPAGLKIAFQALSPTCDNCHESYRVKH